MPKFIIVDQSLRDLSGHHHQYSVSTAAAAAKRGYEPVVLVHRDFDTRLTPADLRMVPLFSEGARDVSTRSGGVPEFPLRRSGRQVEFLRRIAPLRWAWRSAKSAASLARRALAALRARWAHGFQRIKARLRRIAPLRWAWRVARLAPGLAWISIDQMRSRDEPWGFGQSVLHGLSRLNGGPEDHVFIHTLRVEELEDLLLWMLEGSRSELPFFHVLMRRDYEEGIIRNARGMGLLRLLESLQRSRLWPEKIALYTDTDGLTRQYEGLGPVSFVTAPIPFRYDPIAQAAPRQVGSGDRPLNVVYLGDAREEKGYQWLPGVVQALYESHGKTGRLRFTLQSYIQPGNAATMGPHFERLARFPSSYVRLETALLSPPDYYRMLDEADIVLIPYDAKAYLRRSSGILAEALMAGKPVVVPRDTWMAEMVDTGRGATFGEPAELAHAICRVAEGYPAFRAAAEAFARVWRARHSPEALVDRLLETAAPHVRAGRRKREAPIILFIIHGDYFSNPSGAATLARNQLEYLADCGYRVYGVFPPWPAETWIMDPHRGQEAQIKRAILDVPLERAWVPRYAPRGVHLYNALRLSAARRPGRLLALDLELMLRSGYRPPASLLQCLAKEAVTAVLLNYITNWPLLENLRLRDVPVICETVDLQTYQIAIYGQQPPREADIRHEISLLDRCDALLMISASEYAKVVEQLDPSKVFYNPAGFLESPVRQDALAGYENLKTLFESLEMDSSDGTLEFLERNGQPDRLARLSHLDLLFVSTWHLPNVNSLNWFVREVYAPYLAPAGVTLSIAGTICMDEAVRMAAKMPGVYLAGRCVHLARLYAASRLVVVPVVEGAGTSIKAVEALAYGKPLVATSFAMRGIPFDRSEYAVFDGPEAFARQVLHLLGDAAERLQVARRGYEVFQRFCARAPYYERMNTVFRSVIGDRALTPAPAPESPGLPALVEWNEEVAALNSLLFNYVKDLPPPIGQRECLLALMKQRGDGVPQWRAFHDAYLRRLVRHADAKLAARAETLQRAGSEAFIGFVLSGQNP